MTTSILKLYDDICPSGANKSGIELVLIVSMRKGELPFPVISDGRDGGNLRCHEN
jgi:hypothetical protein